MSRKIKKIISRKKKTGPGRGAHGATSRQSIFQRALALQQADRLPEAEALYRQILLAQPSHPEAHNNLANIFLAQGKLKEAEAGFRQALALKPAYEEAHNNLGVILNEQDRLDEAADSYRRALVLNPSHAGAHYGLSAVLQAQGKLTEAEAGFRRALALKPDLANAHYNLGGIFKEQGRPEEAEASYRQTLVLNPADADAYNNLGIILKEQGRLDEAEIALREAVALKPNDVEVNITLGSTLKEQGRLEEAVSLLQGAVALQPGPGSAKAYSNLLMYLNYLPHVGQKEIYEKSRQWDKLLAGLPPERNFEHANGKEVKRRLKIGYVSADFRTHSVACFVAPLLRAHNREKVEVYCYANVKKPDGMTRQLQSVSDHWRSIADQPEDEAEEGIRRDRIDILVDLGGHTGENNLLLFARKPAPIQVTWLGYPNTTGMQSMDYRFTDAVADPPGEADQLHSERLIRLEHGFLCYQPDQSSLAVSPPPSLEQGWVTFGSFNNLAKVNPEVVKVWAAILQQEPRSRLLLKSRPLVSAKNRQRYLRLFAENGIAEDRLALYGWLQGKNEHLELYHKIDIGLDPFPYTGTTTTCEALWMGVPVVTMSGERHAARVGASILQQVGLEELVTHDKEGYLETAVALARDRQRLQTLRKELRPRLGESPLLNANLFAATVEDAYRRMWLQWCEK